MITFLSIPTLSSIRSWPSDNNIEETSIQSYTRAAKIVKQLLTTTSSSQRISLYASPDSYNKAWRILPTQQPPTDLCNGSTLVFVRLELIVHVQRRTILAFRWLISPYPWRLIHRQQSPSTIIADIDFYLTAFLTRRPLCPPMPTRPHQPLNLHSSPPTWWALLRQHITLLTL